MSENLVEKENVFTVSQLTNIIKTLLEESLPVFYLKGEISNWKVSSSGHAYFVLKDSQAQINACMFKGRLSTLDFIPKDGMMVQIVGSVSVYAQRGSYQVVCNRMTKCGIGDIMEMLEERKKRLAQEGVFDSTHKKPIPFFPETIGVVTSPTGAALRDILNIRQRRNDKVNVIVFPTLVQGSEAASSIVKMIQVANSYKMCDVLIVGRGGGSLEDLLPFSEECVCRAIYDSEIPVISAVGHEIDWALSDYVADVRAPTPSAAAEIAIPLKSDIINDINFGKETLYTTITNRLNSLRLMLKQFTPQGMELQLRRIQTPLLNRYSNAKDSLIQNMEDLIKEKRNQVESCVQILENCNPQTIFDKGYSMVKTQDGKILRDSSVLKPGETIFITPSKGNITATVEKIN